MRFRGCHPGVRLGLRQARAADAGRRRPADGDRQREHHQRHGHGGVRRVPDEPVQPALQRDPVRAAQCLRLDRPGLGRAARRRARAVDRLAGVLPRLDRRRAARTRLALVLRRPIDRLEDDPEAARSTPCNAQRARASAARRFAARLRRRRRRAPRGGSAALGREGVDVGPPSRLRQARARRADRARRRRPVPGDVQQAAARRALAPESHPQLRRLRAIAARIIPFTYEWNPRARDWRWEINLIGSAAGQRLLHAGRQDRLLLRHSRAAAARR